MAGTNTSTVDLAAAQEALRLANLQICEVGGGNLLPLFGDAEQEWPKGLRIPLYAIGLLYSFIGIAIIADLFMQAIERITSKESTVSVAIHGQSRRFHVKVWNYTVANLTLMALGSSAPEIILSITELLTGSMFIGELGASTIVGSAAFNLFIISAICILAIPPTEVKIIKFVDVYGVTAVTSVFAYVWLYICVAVWTPDYVTIEEGVLTFSFFPLLVVIAYCVDKGFHRKVMQRLVSIEETDDMDAKLRNAIAEKVKNTTKDTQTKDKIDVGTAGDKESPRTDVAKVARVANSIAVLAPPKSRAVRRIQTTRTMFRGKKVLHDKEELIKEIETEMLTDRAKESRMSLSPTTHDRVIPINALGMSEGAEDPLEIASAESHHQTALETSAHSRSDLVCVKVQGGPSKVGFRSHCYSPISTPTEHVVKVDIVREGDLSRPCTVHLMSRNGTAEAGRDFEMVDTVLEFKPEEHTKLYSIPVMAVADHLSKPMYFHIYIEKIKGAHLAMDKAVVALMSNEDAGMVNFQQDTYHCNESEKIVVLEVTRTGPCVKPASCEYYTQDDTAIADADYIPVTGTLDFQPGEHFKTISIEIVDDETYEKTEAFRVILHNPTGGLRFDPLYDGGEDRAIAVVYIHNNDAVKGKVDHIFALLNADALRIGTSSWADQFKEAWYVNGSKEEQEDASAIDWILHIITLPWKLTFCLVPPPGFFGGWLAFLVSLGFIFCLTAIVGDLAGLLGCCMGLPAAVTGVTFVAIGTSLPDTFASKIAAQDDPHADACVGNVTGSNAVNVFLGMGLPWLVGSLYWRFNGVNDGWIARYDNDKYSHIPLGQFAVPQGSLGTSLSCYIPCSIAALIILIIRRRVVGGELGGNRTIAWITSGIMVSFWVAYVLTVSLVEAL